MRSAMTDRRLRILGAALAAPARADDKHAAKTAAKQATTDYKLGDFKAALGGYSEAYRLFPAPGLLFNIAQCHKNLKNHEQAIHFYEGYLRELPKAKNRSDVEALLAETRRELDAQRAAEEQRRQEEQARAEAEKQRAEAEKQRAETERIAAERKLQQQLEQQRAAEDARRRDAGAPIYKKWWFWTAVGVVAVAAGGTVYVVTSDSGSLPEGSLGNFDAR